MTLSARTLVLHIILILSLLFLLSALFAVCMIFREEAVSQLLIPIETGRSWLGLTFSMDSERVLYSLGAALFAPLFSFLTFLAVERFFRRTLSPQVFFFAVFLLGLSFEAGRAVQAYLYLYEVSYSVLAMVTRFVAFGRIMAMGSLVAASLYASGISYQKNGVVLAIIVAIAGGISYASPVNTLVVAPDLLFRMGEGLSVDVVHLLLGVVGVVNYLQAAWAEERREYIAHAVALLLMVVGWLLLVELPLASGLGVGAFSLVTGTVLFLKRRYSSYLWS